MSKIMKSARMFTAAAVTTFKNYWQFDGNYNFDGTRNFNAEVIKEEL